MASILIVDDDSSVLAVTEELLKSQKYKTHKAVNVAHAMALLEINWIDLIVLDLSMPRKNGTYLFSFLDEYFPSIKVIVYSGYDLHNHPERDLILQRSYAFVPKGENPKVLLKKIKKALKK